MIPSRPLFGLERVWWAADTLWPPFVNQLVVEGEGKADIPALTKALETITPAWPAARARLHGWLGQARWSADGALPVVAAGGAWDGVSPHPALAAPLPPERGPIVELVAFDHHLVLRTHHAAFDGRAAWALAEDLGRALRGVPVAGAEFAAVREPPGGQATAEPPADVARFLGVGGSVAVWTRRTLPPDPHRLLPRVLAAFAELAGVPVRISVPVDTRRHLGSERPLAANLTGIVHLKLAPGDSAEHAHAALSAALTAGTELGSLRAADALRHLPLQLLCHAGKSSVALQNTTGLCTSTATVSNLGRAEAGVLDHAGFRGTSIWWIPPVNPGSPVFLTLTGHAGGVELVVAMMGAPEVAEKLADALVGRLSSPRTTPLRP